MTDIRSNSLAKYPGLWRACVFAAAPCLGPSGSVLRTFSPTHNTATLTNMDPATDWVVSGGRYALDFDGTNDHVNVASPVGVTSTGRQCISFWFRCTGTIVTGNYPCMFSLGVSGGPYTSQLNCGFNQFASGTSGGTGRITTLSYDGVSTSSGCYSNTNFQGTSSWNHVVTGWDGAAWRVIINGVDETNPQNTQLAPITITAPRMVWGGHSSLNRPALVQLDDMRMYHRFLHPAEIRLLASRRGVAYEQRRRSMFFPAAVASGVSLTAGAGAGTGAGLAPVVMAGAEPAAGVGAGAGSGQGPAGVFGHVLSLGAGSSTGTGHAPSLNVGGAVLLTAGAGGGSGSGHAPSVSSGHSVTLGAGSGAGVGYSTSPEIGAFVSLGRGTGTGTGYAPTVSTGGAVLVASRRRLFLSGGLFV